MTSNPITTTPKQSLKLIELGFTPASADFMWIKLDLIKPQLILRSMGSHYSDIHYKKIPAWSLSSLIDFLPDEIPALDGNDTDDLAFADYYSLHIEKSDTEGYTVAYSAGKESQFLTVKDNLVSAVVRTLEWLVNDYGWTAQVLTEWIKELE